MPHRLASIIKRQISTTGGGLGTGHSVSRLSTLAEIDAIADAWRALHQASEGAAIFQNFDWCRTWLQTVNAADPSYRSPRVIRVDDPQGAPVALLPFCVKDRGRFSYAEWIGEPLIQYGDILLAPEADIAGIQAALIANPDVWEGVRALHMRKVRADARIHALVPLGQHGATETESAAIADLGEAGDADAYLTRQSSRTRKTRRARRRKLGELGTLGFDVQMPGPQARAICEKAIGWKADWLRKNGQTSRAFASPVSLDVILNAAGDAEGDSGLRTFSLTLDDVPIAVEIAFVERDTIYAFLGAYDPDHERFGVGNLQIEDTIRYAFNAGLGHYDLLAPMTDYKTGWTNSTVDVCDHVVPLDLAGEFVVDGYYRYARPFAKSAYGTLPDWIRKPILHLMNL